ncbi:MAG: hypothetical protein IIB00_00655 [candidate division Zixibacteria bacterium]|nr:hypothetical protein [candidate division Zixibacteria bacterium]
MIYTRFKRVKINNPDHSVIKWVVAFLIFMGTLTFTVWDVEGAQVDTNDPITVESQR